MKRKSPSVQPKAQSEFDVEAYLASPGGITKVARYRRGEVVFSQGEPGADIRYIQKGQKGAIKLSVLSHSGKEAVVAMLAPGDFFGEGVLAGQPVRIGTATAVAASIVMVKISQETLAEMIGTTRSRVNFFMNKFKKLWLIEYNGGLKINRALF